MLNIVIAVYTNLFWKGGGHLARYICESVSSHKLKAADRYLVDNDILNFIFLA